MVSVAKEVFSRSLQHSSKSKRGGSIKIAQTSAFMVVAAANTNAGKLCLCTSHRDYVFFERLARRITLDVYLTASKMAKEIQWCNLC